MQTFPEARQADRRARGAAVKMIEPLAVLSADEFDRGRGLIDDLASHCTYEDWMESREGLYIGLSLGGIDARLVSVSLNGFLDWCERRLITPTERALDAFALLQINGDSDDFVAAPVLDSPDFLALREHCAFLAPFQRHDHWRRREQARIASLRAWGVAVVEANIDAASFLEWTRCLGQSNDRRSLSQYARLLLEDRRHADVDPA
jgi:hypothetical protein